MTIIAHMRIVLVNLISGGVAVVSKAGQSNVTDLQWLERAIAHYHMTLLHSPEGQDCLRSLGITSLEVISAFRIGYADGTVTKKLSVEGRRALKRLGVIGKSGSEIMKGCLIFPLAEPQSGQVINLYGYYTELDKSFYLSSEQRGIFNQQGARSTDEVIITQSVIDAAVLWSIGIRNAIPAYDDIGLTDELINHLTECRINRALLLSSLDSVSNSAMQQARLAEANIESRKVELPGNGVRDFILQGGTADGLRALTRSATTSSEQSQKSESSLETTSDGALLYSLDGHDYRIRGLSPTGLDRMKVNLRLTAGQLFYLDSLDLYHARARASFAQAAAKLCGISEQRISSDLLQLIEKLEAARLHMRGAKEQKRAEMTQAERAEALAYLQSPDVLRRVVEDFRTCGLVGESATILTAYLASISRKLAEPLGLLIVARSGAGKTALQDALCAFVPPEDVVRVTRLTGQALFYKDPNSLKQKLLVISEEEGASQAVYSLRILASDQRLSIAATRTNEQSGKLSTEHYEVLGPVVIVITTTSAEAFDEETRSRFVQLTLDESVEQTRAILEKQRHRYTLDGVLERATAERIHRLHHNVQHLLRPLEVVNPYIDYLTFPSERLIHRREQKKYLALINTIALMHQHQREIKRAVKGNVEIEYVEVSLDDIALANELTRDVLSNSLDELSPPVRGIYEEIKALCVQRAKQLKGSPCKVQLSRREIRDLTGWSDWQVRTYCDQLVALEYLDKVSGANGKKYLYQLSWYLADESSAPSLQGLVNVDQIRERIRHQAELVAR